jgi:hypothetical protein
LVKQGKTWDQAAMMAAMEIFPAEFKPAAINFAGSLFDL